MKSILKQAIFIPFILFLLLLSFIRCTNTDTNLSDISPSSVIKVVRQAAEYDPQEAVWLIWSPIDHLDGFSNEQVTLDIIKQLVPNTNVKITAAKDELYERAKSMIPAAYLEGGSVQLIKIPSVELWARDMGPVFVEDSLGRKVIADFNFDAWGYGDTTEADTKIEEKYDELIGAHQGLPIISSNMISEGGNREVNGEGTLMVVEKVEMGRNPSMTKEEMEAEFQRMLGVSNVIWLKEGLKEDDHTFLGPIETHDGKKAYTVITTNGHIDEFARFVNDSTILLAQVDSSDLDDPIAMENYRRMEENYAILQNAKDQDGKPFKIVRMPLPKTILGEMKPGDAVYDYISTLEYKDGSEFPAGESVSVIAAASYLNFLITDNLILGQKYWRDGLDEAIKARDEQATQILQEVFPNRKVVMLDALAINYGGGGIHCISMQEPKLQ